MTRVKSLAHGLKTIADPYESPPPLTKSTYHREHRSKKNRRFISQYGKIGIYRRKLKKLKELEYD